MTEEKKAQHWKNIWSIKDEVITKNKNHKKDKFDIPDEDKIVNNVNGYIINSVGNIVAKFGFFVETEGNNKIGFKISADGFMGCVYNKPTNVLLGYGHPTGFAGLVDPKQTQILHLGPDQTNGDQLIISIKNDEHLKTNGIVCIIRDEDVILELLPEDVAADYKQSLIEAKNTVTDLNELEMAYNAYMRHLYKILGEQFNMKDNVTKESHE